MSSMCPDGTQRGISTTEHDANISDHAYHVTSDVEEQYLSDCLQHHNYCRQPDLEAHSESTDTNATSRKRQASGAAMNWRIKKQKNCPATQSTTRSTLSFKPKCIQYLQMSKYKQALNEMRHSRNRFLKSALIDFFARLIREEVAAFVKSPVHSVFGQPFSFQNLSQFKWENAVSELNRHMPFSAAALQSLFPDARSVSKRTTVGKKKNKR